MGGFKVQSAPKLPIAMWCFITLIFVQSCNEVSDDVIRPEIVRFSIVNDTVAAGNDELLIDIEVRDDEELSQLRFRIQEAFAKNFGQWRVVRIEDISGLSHQNVYSFSVPDTSLSGLYEIYFQVVDVRGNASIDSIQKITITQEGLQPLFSGFTTIPLPEPSGEVVLFPDDTLTFSGSVSDATGLDRLDFEFRGSAQNVLASRTYFIPDSVDNTVWNGTDADSVFFTEFQELPTSLVVKALNIEGHQSRRAFELFFFP
jgi:hypothetical protein